jgi:hypothetical protein
VRLSKNEDEKIVVDLTIRERDIIRNCLAYLCYAGNYPDDSPVWDGNNEEIVKILSVIDSDSLSKYEIKIIANAMTFFCYVVTPHGYTIIANAKIQEMGKIINDFNSIDWKI